MPKVVLTQPAPTASGVNQAAIMLSLERLKTLLVLPADAKLVAVDVVPGRTGIIVIIEHASLPSTPPGIVFLPKADIEVDMDMNGKATFSRFIV